MLLARVVGTVWSSVKAGQLEGYKLLLVRPHFSYRLCHPTESLVVLDVVGAGVGEDVVIAFGAPARWACHGGEMPVEAAVMAIVDRFDLAPCYRLGSGG